MCMKFDIQQYGMEYSSLLLNYNKCLSNDKIEISCGSDKPPLYTHPSSDFHLIKDSLQARPMHLREVAGRTLGIRRKDP